MSGNTITILYALTYTIHTINKATWSVRLSFGHFEDVWANFRNTWIRDPQGFLHVVLAPIPFHATNTNIQMTMSGDNGIENRGDLRVKCKCSMNLVVAIKKLYSFSVKSYLKCLGLASVVEKRLTKEEILADTATVYTLALFHRAFPLTREIVWY